MGSGSLVSTGESVIVVMDVNRSTGNAYALNWALNHVVRPKDTVVVLGILPKFGKKSSCFPFYMDLGIFAIWERLEFSGHTEMTAESLEEEIEKKREQYQSTVQPFYRKCKRNEVKLEVKLAAGFDPKNITIEEAKKTYTRWIVLDSNLKKDKAFIHGHVGCNIAAMKRRDVATIMPSKSSECEGLAGQSLNNNREAASAFQPEKPQDEHLSSLPGKSPVLPPPSPCWYPLSWRTGFPRNFTHTEIETITNGLSDDNIISKNEDVCVYQGTFLEIPVLVKCFSANDEQFWSELKILSRIRHRNILNLVGHCFSDASMFLLQDYPVSGSLDMHLKRDELAENLSWRARWEIALGIGGCLRYLHEECLDGHIAHLSVSSSTVVFSHSGSAMLTNFTKAEWLKDDIICDEASSKEEPNERPSLVEDERLSSDVHAYGLLLLELIAGQRASLVDWALPLLKSRSLSQLMDPRLENSCDVSKVDHMADAAFLCLKNDPVRGLSMSQVVAVVRGDKFGICHF